MCNWKTIGDDYLEIVNGMFTEMQISSQQKLGIIVCLPKCTDPRSVLDYRPITLLTTEYKFLALIMARRLRQFLADQLQGHSSAGYQVPQSSTRLLTFVT
jgi:hypothetical protein